MLELIFRHLASRTEQEAKGHLERQKIADEAEGRICIFYEFLSYTLNFV